MSVLSGRASAPGVAGHEALGLHPLTPAQERIWRFGQREPASSLYHVPLLAWLIGPLHLPALQAAFAVVASRHEALRLRFRGCPGGAVLQTAVDAVQPLAVEDLSRLAPDAQEAVARRRIREEAMRPFDLEADGPLRARLLRLDPERHALLVTLHHICVDAWSLAILFRELGDAYGARLHGHSGLERLPPRYTEYAVSERQRLAAESPVAGMAYWRGRLAGRTPPLLVPGGGAPEAAFQGGTHRFELAPALMGALGELARRGRTTRHVTLLAAFQLWLAWRTGAPDLRIGTPASCRTRQEVEDLVGLLVNTTVIRAHHACERTFGALVEETRRLSLEALAHQEVPYELILAELQPEADPDRNPGFEVWFVLRGDRTPWTSPVLQLPGVRVDFEDVEPETVRFDLKLDVVERPGRFPARFEYNRGRLDPAAAGLMAEEFQRLALAAVGGPDLGLAEVAARAGLAPPPA